MRYVPIFVLIMCLIRSILPQAHLIDVSSQFHSNIPIFQASESSRPYIHRFFDSSPFSPSGRFFSMIKYLIKEKGIPNPMKSHADIVVVDLHEGNRWTVASTNAWDTQVGAHIQWGRSDSELIFNDIERIDGKNESGYLLFGVVLDIFTNQSKRLPCPVYHVNRNGISVTPNLAKIKYTQVGYGVHIPNVPPYDEDDGIYVMNITSGRCRKLLLLNTILAQTRDYLLSNDQKRMDSHHFEAYNRSNMLGAYGFHTKWSFDGKFIMVVLRTIHGYNSKYFRRQHLFVVEPKGKRPPLHVISWSSMYKRSKKENSDSVSFNMSSLYSQLVHPKSVSTYRISQDRSASSSLWGKSFFEVDGNHPNWIPNSHRISMNLDLSIFENVQSPRCPWSLVEFDVNELIRNQGKSLKESIYPTTISSNANITNAQKHLQLLSSFQRMYLFKVIYNCSSGHPSFHIDSRYALLDAYAKEYQMFLPKSENREISLRLLDIEKKSTTTILKVR